MVRVRFFASLREEVGLEQEDVKLPAGATVKTFLQTLARAHPGLGALLEGRGVRFAVNRCYVPPDAGLQEGDEVALVPPVGGG
ncbi:MAG TPA: molybdopterin converting factor subunit 1 [Anaerolineae bacterium]|nr:molybdopterin converting factor subunit 1 [Anaerolineae bacterium]